MMPKVVVLYDSQTGFTESMAKGVVEGVRMVRGVDVELLKAGTPFSISKLDEADAIILGSPTHYGDTTPAIKVVLESIRELIDTMKIKFFGKIGGIFVSYGWDSESIIEKLREEMRILRIDVVVPPIAVLDRMGRIVQDERIPVFRLDEESLERCRELGRLVALNFVD
jgi:flavorubredoxin